METTRPPRGRTVAPPQNQQLEAQADRAAALALSGGYSRAALQLGSFASPRLQRKCSCGGTCDKCQHDQEELQVQRKPDDSPAPAPAPSVEAPPAATAAPATPVPDPKAEPVLVEDGQPVQPNQMNHSAFVALLRAQLLPICDLELAAVGRTAQGCPYLTRYLDEAQSRPASQVERAIRMYTGTAAKTPQGLIDAVVSRVRAAIRVWIASGQIAGVPDVSGTAGTLLDLGSRAASAVSGFFTPSVQTKRVDGAATPATASPTAVRAQLGSGRSLDSGVRSRMESGFGVSFAGVRIHTDETAARVAGGLSARAFTVGRDVAFNAGEYRPGTVEGDLLIAHELAHTVQQSGASHEEAGGGHHLEEDADYAAAGAVGSQFGLSEQAVPRGKSGLRLQRCSQTVVKRCPPHYSWRVQSTTGWGSFGCTCHWKCMPGDPPGPPPSSGMAYRCPPDMNCSTGVKYEELGSDYTKKGFGAAMTPLGGDPYCGCFPLNFEGQRVSDSPMQPTDFEMTDVAGPLADVAAARRGSKPQTDPQTGKRLPGEPEFEPGKPGKPPTAITGNLGVDVETGMGRVGDIRDTFKVGKGRNIAFADYDIEGMGGNQPNQGSLIGLSGPDKPGTAPTPANPEYPAIVVGHDRSLDSEKKIIENLTQMIGDNPDATGTVRLFSERDVCAGCDVVISQFRARYPKIQVTIVSGRRYR